MTSRSAASSGTAPARSRVGRGLAWATDHFLLLPIGGLLALVWANVAPESYFSVAVPLRFPVNEIAMALFFALVTQEIVEALLPGGALHTWRRWTLPVAAAAGATFAAALTYLTWVAMAEERMFSSGWPVAAAIDVALVYAVVRSVYPRHAALPFALIVAVCTDACLALFAGRLPFASAQPTGLVLLLGSLAIAMVLRRRRVRSFWPYLLLCGPVSWWALRMLGLHPALALVPIVAFVPHAPRSLELFTDHPHGAHDSPRHLEHALIQPVHLTLFAFGLVNAGVPLSAYGTGTWALLAASLVARPAGLFAGTAVALALGLHLPRGLHWRDIGIVGLLSSGGFAMGLFFATAVVPLGPLQAQLKLGVLLAGVGVPIGLALARLWHVGRFSPVHRHAAPSRAPVHASTPLHSPR